MPQTPEFEAIIKNCDKQRIVNFLKTIFPGKGGASAKFGGIEQGAADGITVLGSVTLLTGDGRPKPVLCCAKQMNGVLTERSSRRKQFDAAVRVLKENFNHAYSGNGPVQGAFTQGLFFFFDEPGNFRLSLVTAEISAGKMELNNYRRQSFFVEAGKNNKTFRTRLCKAIANYDELKSAFDVEKLSDEFFREYKVFYEDIVQYITGARYIEVKKNKYERKDMSGVNHEIYDQFVNIYGDDAERAVRNYVKKLMGRLVFIQFLQKKGWLGNLAGANTWNSGDRDFMQSLFLEITQEDRENFIDNILEKIFFEEFNTKEENRHIKNATLKKYKFPFLNCGLFDRDADDKLDFKLPATVFCNLKFSDTERKAPNIKDWTTKRKPYFNDGACGLFDFFDRFNFTIDENDPTDAEVSVDPEMLGKIFENLLEDNKDKGAFYTPKEIVNYMVNEALIAYLETETSLRAKGEAIQMENAKVIEPAEITASRIRNFVLTQDSSAFSATEKTLLDTKLAEVKICDPAIGSGAFPMGLLNLLCKCRQNLQPVEKQHDKKTIAALKRDIIQQNIYGVDIEKGAVDIARLRFWLSLIVDEESPEVLPNLEFKIMQGNSLLESYEGIDLSGIAGEKGNRSRAQSKDQLSLVFNEKQAIEQIQKDLNKFYKTDSHAEKESLTQSINNGVKSYIKFIAPQKSKEIDAMPVPNDKFFLWHTYFRDVFNRKGKEGFDIVIGNPPYVDVKSLPSDDVNLYFRLFETTENRINLYSIFIERCLNLMSSKGLLCFINPNSILINESYEKIRRKIISQVTQIIKLPDNVFNAATVETIILLLTSSSPNLAFCKCFLNNDAIDLHNLKLDVFEKKDWECDNQCRFNIFSDKETVNICKKMESGCNELSNYIETSLGITPYDKAKGHSKKLIEERRYHSDTKLDNSYVPLVSGKNIHNYFVDNESPKEYLKYGPWLGAPREKRFFTSPKIIIRQILGEKQKIIAAYSEKDHFFTQIGFSLISKHNDKKELKFLLGLLNSKVMSFYHMNKFLDKQKVTFQKILIANAKKFPIPAVTPAQQKPIIDLVDSILAAKKKDPSADTSKLEEEIDNLVYDLYGLTQPEINIVKGMDSSPSAQNDVNKAGALRQAQGPAASDDFLLGEEL